MPSTNNTRLFVVLLLLVLLDVSRCHESQFLIIPHPGFRRSVISSLFETRCTVA
jgi:hypothetical protein